MLIGFFRKVSANTNDFTLGEQGGQVTNCSRSSFLLSRSLKALALPGAIGRCARSVTMNGEDDLGGAPVKNPDNTAGTPAEPPGPTCMKLPVLASPP